MILSVETLLGIAPASQSSVGESEVIVLWFVSWDVALIPWDVEILLCNWSTLNDKGTSALILKHQQLDLPSSSCRDSWCDTC